MIRLAIPLPSLRAGTDGDPIRMPLPVQWRSCECPLSRPSSAQDEGRRMVRCPVIQLSRTMTATWLVAVRANNSGCYPCPDRVLPSMDSFPLPKPVFLLTFSAHCAASFRGRVRRFWSKLYSFSLFFGSFPLFGYILLQFVLCFAGCHCAILAVMLPAAISGCTLKGRLYLVSNGTLF